MLFRPARRIRLQEQYLTTLVTQTGFPSPRSDEYHFTAKHPIVNLNQDFPFQDTRGSNDLRSGQDSHVRPDQTALARSPPLAEVVHVLEFTIVKFTHDVCLVLFELSSARDR
jgi:hypothetical protein